jgi:hypothetical protein
MFNNTKDNIRCDKEKSNLNFNLIIDLKQKRKIKKMKRVKANAYQIGLVFKDGVYQRMLKEGNYWFWGGETIQLYDLTKPFTAPIELNILLKDAALAQALEVVEIKDGEIVLQYENGLLKQVLTAGRYAFWKGVMEYKFVRADIRKVEITEPIELDVLLGKQVAPFVRSASVEQYEKAVLFVNGNFSKILQGGAYYWWKNATSVSVSRVDVRQQQLEINGQEILTKDKAALRINAWAQYKVTDIEKALLQNKEYDKQLYVAFQLALREYVAGFAFDELLDKKENIADYVIQRVEKDAQALGVTVIGFGIRDIILPGDVKEIMNQVLIAEKKAQANTIMRREETASMRSMLNTAKLMEENNMLWKLKEMEYVEKIADKISNISVSGNGVLIEQLKDIFIPKK